MAATNSEIRIVDNMLMNYAQAINKGFGFIEGDVQFLMSVFIGISITLSALFWALKGEDILAPFLKKILLIGFFAFLINNWPSLMGVIVKSFVQLGNKAGGSPIDPNTMFSPGKVAGLGIDYWLAFDEAISGLTGPVEFFVNIVDIVILFIVGLIVVAAFFVMAVQIFVTLVMFKLVTLAAFVLVPFGVLKHTSFMSERALGLVVSYGLKFFTLSLILAIGYGIFSTLKPVDVLNINESFSLMLASVVLLMLAMQAPAVASELITGGPQIGAGAMAGAGLAAGAAAGGAAYLGAKMAAGGASMAANPLIKAANAGNISINGQPMSAKNSASSLNTEGLSGKSGGQGSAGGSSSPQSGGGTAAKGGGAGDTGKTGPSTQSGGGSSTAGSTAGKASGTSESVPTYHSQSGQSGGSQENKKSGGGAGKAVTAGSAAASSMARGDSSGGISSTGSSQNDEEGE